MMAFRWFRSVPFHFIWFDSRQNIIITFSVFAFSLGNVLNSKIYACILLHRSKYYRGRCTSNSFLKKCGTFQQFGKMHFIWIVCCMFRRRVDVSNKYSELISSVHCFRYANVCAFFYAFPFIRHISHFIFARNELKR